MGPTSDENSYINSINQRMNLVRTRVRVFINVKYITLLLIQTL